jgi:hypothetical protein
VAQDDRPPPLGKVDRVKELAVDVELQLRRCIVAAA